jgi:hypothetical protein
MAPTDDDDNDYERTGRDFVKSFGKAGAGFYPPKVETIERHPDKRPSSALIEYRDDKDGGITMVVEVRGEYGGVIGAVVIRASGGHEDGKLHTEGMSAFDKDSILFD